MPRFSANISTLFTEHALVDRFAAAREAGFRAVEVQFPYDFELDKLVRARDEAGVAVVLINLPGGDWDAGDRGLAALPDRVENFRASVPLARLYAEALGCRRVNALAGIPDSGQEPEACHAALADNLQFAAAEMDLAGIRVVVEAINRTDVPGFFLGTSAEALAAIGRAGHPNLALQYDAYHMTVIGEDIVATVERLVDRIGHVQIADAPGRHEPGSGTIDFPAFFAALDRSGYQGWVGAEYLPSGHSADSLAWFESLRA